MTYTYTVELNEKEKRALEYAVYDINEWIVNAAKHRASVAANEIIEINTEYCNKNEIAIDVGQLAQIEQAYGLGIIQTGYKRTIEHIAKEKKLLEAEEAKESKKNIKLKFL